MAKAFIVTRRQQARITAPNQQAAEELANELQDDAFGDSPAYLVHEDPNTDVAKEERMASWRVQEFIALLHSGKVDSPHQECMLEDIAAAAQGKGKVAITDKVISQFFEGYGAWVCGWELGADKNWQPMPKGFGGN